MTAPVNAAAIEAAAWALRVFEQPDADPVHFRQSIDYQQYTDMAVAMSTAALPFLRAEWETELRALLDAREREVGLYAMGDGIGAQINTATIRAILTATTEPTT